MIVICKRGTKRLIKGHRYEVRNLWNNGTNQGYGQRGKVFIEGIGRFAVSGFTTLDGKELPKTNYTKPGTANQPAYTSFKFEDVSVGDILVCKTDRYKTFVKDGMYKVEELITDKKSRVSFRINQNNTAYMRVTGAKSIIRHNLPSQTSVTLDKANSRLVFTGNPPSYGTHSFTIKLDGHDDIKGRFQFTGWGSATIADISENFIKFVGVKRKMKFSAWRFRKLNPQEAREISLSHVLDGEEVNVIVSTEKRNIELVDDKDDILMKTLAKSILDANRHHLSIIDWASQKNGEKLQIESKDYEPYLNLTLAQILEKIK